MELSGRRAIYITFPLLLWLASKFVNRRMALLLAALLAISFALNVILVYWKPQSTFYLLPTRAWEFAVGAIIPDLRTQMSRYKVNGRWLLLAGIALIVASFAVYSPTLPFPGWYAVLPVAATAALLLGGGDRGGLVEQGGRPSGPSLHWTHLMNYT